MVQMTDKERAKRLAWGLVTLLDDIHAADYASVADRYRTLRGIADGNKASTVKVRRLGLDVLALAEAEIRIAYAKPDYSARHWAAAQLVECDALSLTRQGDAMRGHLRTLSYLESRR